MISGYIHLHYKVYIIKSLSSQLYDNNNPAINLVGFFILSQYLYRYDQNGIKAINQRMFE